MLLLRHSSALSVTGSQASWRGWQWLAAEGRLGEAVQISLEGRRFDFAAAALERLAAAASVRLAPPPPRLEFLPIQLYIT